MLEKHALVFLKNIDISEDFQNFNFEKMIREILL